MEKIFDTDRRIRLGIWGLGRGQAFVSSAKALNIDVVAGCDVNSLMRENFKKNFPDVYVTDNDEEFLANCNLDAVLIATWFPDHAQATIRALQHGLHVMCEVTAFFTPGEGVQVVEAVEKSGKVYNLLENYPFSKENLYLAQLYKEGFFGDFMYGEFEYVHDCLKLSYAYNDPPKTPVAPGYTVHNWRSWLQAHKYNTHSLGPVMKITGLRPVKVTAFPNTVAKPGMLKLNDTDRSLGSCLVQMSNGGVMRNLMGDATCDYHTGKRFWGTRAAAESFGRGLYIQVGTAGKGTLMPVEPKWPALGELAERTGHGGGDFWELYYFARQILTGEPAPWNIYDACDVTLAGHMAIKSAALGGVPQEVPDFRDKAVREKYRNDFEVAPHADPDHIFPAGHNPAITGNYTTIMCKLCDLNPTLRRAVDGAKIYDQLVRCEDKLAIIRQVKQALAEVDEMRQVRKQAQEIVSAYPDCLATRALEKMLEVCAEEYDSATDVKSMLSELLEKLLAGK